MIDNNKKRFTDFETLFHNMISNSLQNYLVGLQSTYNVMSVRTCYDLEHNGLTQLKWQARRGFLK